MVDKIRELVLVISIVLIFLFLFTGNAYTQLELTMSPLTIERNLKPGSKTRYEVFLMNESDKELKIKCKPIDLYQNEMTGQFLPNLKGDKNVIFSCTEWITSKTENIVIEPKSSFLFEGEIIVPKTVAHGSYSSMILFTIEREENEGPDVEGAPTSAYVPIDYYTGSVVFIQIYPRGVANIRGNKFAEIEKFEVTESDKGLLFTAKLVNLGKNFITVNGRLAILKEGEEVRHKPFGGGLVIPGQKVDFKSYISPPYIPGNYKAIVSINYGGLREVTAAISFQLSKDHLITGIAEENIILDTKEVVYLIPNQDTIESKIIPGNIRTFNISITNGSSESVQIKNWAENATKIASTEYAEHIQIKPDNDEIKSNQRKNFKVIISTPKNLEDGNKYAKIIFSPKTLGEKNLSDQEQKMYSSEVFLVLDNVKGIKNEKIKMKKLDIKFIEKENGKYYPRYIFTFENTGNVHINPSLFLKISELPFTEKESGAEVITNVTDSFNLNSIESSGIILPGMDGEIFVDSDRPMEKDRSRYNMEVIFKNGNNEIFKDYTNFELNLK